MDKSPVIIPAARPEAPAFRTCCLLAEPIFTKDSPKEHSPSGGNKKEVSGIIYTCNGGFIDIAHMRDVCDLTRYYHHQLKRKAGKKDETFSSVHHYKILGHNGKIVKDIPRDKLLHVAARLAYLESVCHEIVTYWYIDPDVPGGHNSAFSPEDLVSNHLGANLGIRAIEALEKGTFYMYEDAVTSELTRLLSDLGDEGATATRTKLALGLVQTVPWYIPSVPTTEMKLLRRNFGQNGDFNIVNPWIVPGVTGCTGSTWPVAISKTWDLTLDTYFTITYKPDLVWYVPASPVAKKMLGGEVPHTSFTGHIATLRKHAEQRYGSSYDSPEP